MYNYRLLSKKCKLAFTFINGIILDNIPLHTIEIDRFSILSHYEVWMICKIFFISCHVSPHMISVVSFIKITCNCTCRICINSNARNRSTCSLILCIIHIDVIATGIIIQIYSFLSITQASQRIISFKRIEINILISFIRRNVIAITIFCHYICYGLIRICCSLIC